MRKSQARVHRSNNKIKLVESTLQRYVEDTVLTEDEAKALKDILALDPEDIAEADNNTVKDQSASPLDKYIGIWRENLPVVQDIAEVKRDHIEAFDHRVRNALPDELTEIEAALKAVEDRPIKLTKKMLDLGKEYYDDVYVPLSKYGGFKGLQIAHKKEVSTLKKEIDKLNKEVLQLKDSSDYLSNAQNSYRIPTSSAKKEKETKAQGRFNLNWES